MRKGKRREGLVIQVSFRKKNVLKGRRQSIPSPGMKGWGGKKKERGTVKKGKLERSRRRNDSTGLMGKNADTSEVGRGTKS